MDLSNSSRLRASALDSTTGLAGSLGHVNTNTTLHEASSQKQLAPGKLEVLKPVIKELYIDNGLSFKEVQMILDIQYNCKITLRQFANLRRQWNMKKNTRTTERQKILEAVAISEISEEGRAGTVSLSMEKVKRWRREFENGAKPGHRSTPQEANVAMSRGRDPRTATRRILLPRPDIIRQPSSPQEFNVTEGLLFTIDTYISGMYDPGGAWYPADASQSEDTPGYKLASKFTGSVTSAVGLLKANSFVEARKVLSGACNLVQDMLKTMHPVTFGYLLLVFHGLAKEGLGPLNDAADILRNYIARMATVVLPKAHPWRDICCVFGRIDRRLFRQTLILLMRSHSDSLEKKLGQFNPVALGNRVRYIYYGYADNLPAGEIALRKLLAGCPHPSVSYCGMLAVLGALTANLRDQGRYKEYESLAKEYTSIARKYADGVAVVNGLRATAMAQYKLGERALAEASQREAADLNLADEKDSFNLSWAIEHLTVLESWLREWGRTQDAEKLKEEINELIKRDTAGSEEIVL